MLPLWVMILEGSMKLKWVAESRVIKSELALLPTNRRLGCSMIGYLI
jgi:hypothetical protein